MSSSPNKSDIAVSVRGLSKSYSIAHSAAKHTTAGEALMHRLRHPFTREERETFWALNDVSFDIQRGDVVGIIGRNGAGKSTLLKILSRITEPTAGQIDLYGRVGSLLEVGTGFHAELTGRENIFLNGAILGMSRAEIARQFDAIVDFSGTEQFLDTPVKRYSSGMYVRLAFAVAAHLNPEILIVDEVLAVGDAEFQKKCLGKMQDVAKSGRTVLFVSHNMSAIRSLCQKVVLLERGCLCLFSGTEQVVNEYLTGNAIYSGHWRASAQAPEAEIHFEEITIRDQEEYITGNIDSRKPFRIHIHFSVGQDVANAQIAMRLTNQEGVPLFTTANTDIAQQYLPLRAGKHAYSVEVPLSFLPPGMYNLIVAAMIPGEKLFDVVENEIVFMIEDLGNHATLLRDNRLGVVTPLLFWTEIKK